MVLVEMRATAQAAKVAEATGGAHLLGKNDKDGKALLGHRVDIGTDFEACRAKIESVSVLFKLYEKGGTVPSWRFRLGGRSLEPYSKWYRTIALSPELRDSIEELDLEGRFRYLTSWFCNRAKTDGK